MFMGTTFAFAAIVLLASILQVSTGFGFSIMATPFLLMIFLPNEAIQINIILSLIISTSLIWKIRRDIEFNLLKRVVVGSVVGIPFGVFIFMTMNIDALKLGLGILLVILTLLLMCNFKLKPTPFRDFIVGGLSGALTTSIGMPGPPLLLYFTGTATEKEKLRGTTLAFYLFIYLVSLLSQIAISGTNPTVWKSSLYAIPIVIIGLLVGQMVFKRLNQRVFRVFTYVLLMSTGTYLLLGA